MILEANPSCWQAIGLVEDGLAQSGVYVCACLCVYLSMWLCVVVTKRFVYFLCWNSMRLKVKESHFGKRNTFFLYLKPVWNWIQKNNERNEVQIRFQQSYLNYQNLFSRESISHCVGLSVGPSVGLSVGLCHLAFFAFLSYFKVEKCKLKCPMTVK